MTEKASGKVWFPLRSNIAYFETTGPQLNLEARVKQSALLADELWFEDGLLDVTITPSMALPVWHPPPLDLDEIERREQASAKGEPSGLYIGIQPEKGVPAAPESMHQIAGGPLDRAFLAQYHRLLHTSGLDGVLWASLGMLSDGLSARASRRHARAGS